MRSETRRRRFALILALVLVALAAIEATAAGLLPAATLEILGGRGASDLISFSASSTRRSGTSWTRSAFLAVPAAMAVAILKYRLYDLDIIINRTLVYGTLTAILAVTYFGGVVLLQGLVDPLTEGSNVAVAGSTLAVAGLFRPARRRVQEFIDRRFNRAKYDAHRTIESFSQRLRDEVDLEELKRDLLRVVDETMAPSRGSLWLRPPSLGTGMSWPV